MKGRFKIKINKLLYIDDNDIEIIKRYLKERKYKKSRRQTGLNIVFDLTYKCNLKCLGCAVNATYYKKYPIKRHHLESKTSEIFIILEKINIFLNKYPLHRKKFFIDFGGGEPLLRNDLLVILKRASELFGPNCVGFDTNGTICDTNILKEIAPLINYLGISIDGLREYHNWWRDPNNSFEDAFNTTIMNLNKYMEIEDLAEKIEVTSVITKRNMKQIPKLMKYISTLGVKKYSIHRAMQVGRMRDKGFLVPNANDYLKSTISTLKANEKLHLDFHIHHSLESIYSSLFLGDNSYVSGRIWCNIGRSSIGIDPKGTVYFCPWCIVEPWSKLSPGNLLDDGVDLDFVLNLKGGIIDLAKEFSSPYVRCYPCMEKCGRGCPLASAATFISRNPNIDISNINEQHIISGISSVDPACPKSRFL